jgi:hypothetical protein
MEMILGKGNGEAGPLRKCRVRFTHHHVKGASPIIIVAKLELGREKKFSKIR